jgi:phosphinothricin acetyltransferase
MLRLATVNDAQAILAIYGPVVEETPISFETSVPSLAEMARRIEETLRRYPWLVWDEAGVSAYAYACRHRDRLAYDWSVDVAVYVAPGAQRRGLGRRLYGALLELLTAQNFVMAFAGIALPNTASVTLHEAAGFRPVGIYRDAGYKLGAWRDVGWWQCPLAAPAAPPQPPIALPELLARSPELARSVAAQTSLSLGGDIR